MVMSERQWDGSEVSGHVTMSIDRKLLEDWLQKLQGLQHALEELEAEIIAYLETHYQDWDNPEQETTQRRCHLKKSLFAIEGKLAGQTPSMRRIVGKWKWRSRWTLINSLRI